jgi:hypothetical protein
MIIRVFFNTIALNLSLDRLHLSYLIIICFTGQCFSQNEAAYTQAYEYIYKSKELDDFRDEIRKSQGIIVKRLVVKDSI